MRGRFRMWLSQKPEFLQSQVRACSSSSVYLGGRCRKKSADEAKSVYPDPGAQGVMDVKYWKRGGFDTETSSPVFSSTFLTNLNMPS